LKRIAGSYRVNRGGSWNNNASNARAANRNNNDPANRNNNIGLRVASSRHSPEATCLRTRRQCTGRDQRFNPAPAR